MQQDHETLLSDAVKLRQSQPFPRSSSTEQLDLLLNEQLIENQKKIAIELANIRSKPEVIVHSENSIFEQFIIKNKEDQKDEHGDHGSDFENYSNIPFTGKNEGIVNVKLPLFSNDAVISFQNQDINKFSNNQEKQKNSRRNSARKIENNQSNANLMNSKNLEKNLRIFDPLNPTLTNNDEDRRILIFHENAKTPPKIFDPFRNNGFYNELFVDSDGKKKIFNPFQEYDEYGKNKGKAPKKEFFQNNEQKMKLSEFYRSNNFNRNSLQYLSEYLENKRGKSYKSMKKMESVIYDCNNDSVLGNGFYEKKVNNYMDHQKYSPKNMKKINVLNLESSSYKEYDSKLENVDKFKLSCLKSKANIFENDDIQIGFISKLEESQRSHFSVIKIYFTNKNKKNKIKDLEVDYIGDSSKNIKLIQLNPYLIQL